MIAVGRFYQPIHDIMRKPPTIRDLYPHCTGKELREAEEHLDRYLEIMLRIFDAYRD
jgi:hypothetical protein